MALIRASSNPEGLYVFGTTHNTPKGKKSVIEICWGKRYPPYCSKAYGMMSVPHKTFMRVVKKWDKEGPMLGDDPVSFRGFSVLEEFVGQGNDRELLIRVQYKDDFIYLWSVTWEYVVRNALDR